MNNKVALSVFLLCCWLSLLLSQAHGNDISKVYRVPGKLPSQLPNKLTFTFDSPEHPWTADELNIINNALTDFYPVIETLYGEPAFAITVNVRKDPSINFPGEYSPITKEIVLRDATQLDVLCHEMIHAFRDENMLLINSYEEGMTRAVEVEVFNRLAAYTFWNENHSYMYDVYYEGLNRQVIGSQSGNFNYASPFLLLRYDLAGYAWAKVFTENSNFFVDFNRTLYDRTLLDPLILSDVSILRDIASSLQPVVEGKPFLTWYEQQGIFDPTPKEGYFLYQNISNFNVYYFFRDASGSEKMIAGATIQWEIYDHEDSLMLSGSGVTSPLGWIALNPLLPFDYKGRIKIVTAIMTPDGLINNTAFTSAGYHNGIFGIVEGTDTGVITITSLDGDIPSVTTDVAHGIFDAPSLAVEKGRFIAVYGDGEGQIFSKQFNKDASDYFLSMVKNTSIADLSVFQTVTPGQVTVGNNLIYILTVTNNGPDSANEVVLTDMLPSDVSFVSATPSQGSCTSSIPVATCALDTINKGASVTVKITTTPTQTGNIKNNADVTGNISDPDLTNNATALSSTVVDINPAIEIIISLISRITILVDQEILNQGQGESLITLLEAAENHVERDQAIPAINQIHAFMNHITAFVRAGVLTQSQGEALLAMADNIIVHLTPQHQALLP
jgi:uncharacterized repeat protein (TIGR01451 family)